MTKVRNRNQIDQGERSYITDQGDGMKIMETKVSGENSTDQYSGVGITEATVREQQ
jgi:hypothetical protein